MKIKIPYNLRMKFLRHEGFEFTQEKITMPGVLGEPIMSFPGMSHYAVKLNLSKNPECLKACLDWMNICYTDYDIETSYKIDLGGYLGLWPNEITSDGVVTFVMDNYDTSRKHWKDWFIIDEEEIENAPK